MLFTLLAASGAIIIYLSVSVFLTLRLLRAGPAVLSKPVLLGLMLGGALLHGFLVHASLYAGGQLDVSFFTIFSLIAWLVTLLLLITALHEPVENLAIGILPVAALAIVLRVLATQQHPLQHDLSLGMELHILFSLVAYSLLTIAAMQSILLYIQDAQLHNKHPGGFVRALPPLETMERLLFRLIGIGFVVLSIALISGSFYIENIMQQKLAHKLVLSLSAWVLFAILLFGRWRYGWRGRIAIRWTLTGFILLLLAYFGSKFVLELVLNR